VGRTSGVRATDFALSEETADRLFKAGWDAVTTFLDGDATRPKRDCDEYKWTWRRRR
jgi:hypothetical protein